VLDNDFMNAGRDRCGKPKGCRMPAPLVQHEYLVYPDPDTVIGVDSELV
jgi:hypothetical protein